MFFKTVVDDKVRAAVVTILEERFPNGIRPNSVIDVSKLKNYYHEATDEEITSVEMDIPTILNAIGIRHGEKVFAVSSSVKQALAELLDRLLSEDNRLFFYDEFYNAHSDFLQEMHIHSPELLRTVLTCLCSSLRYFKNYFMTGSDVSVESEVLRCYETAACLSYEQLKAKLPYLPLDRIRQVLAQNSGFVWVSTGVYTHISKIQIDENERCVACDKIKEDVSNHGFASIASLDVSASLELNPDLSESAVKNGLFQVCLADKYEKRGNIVTSKGMVLNSVAVFEDFCRSHDRLTLDELLEFEQEINGGVHSQSLYVAYDNMVRTNRGTFVADNEIQFNVDAMDDALALFVNGDVIPLRAVTSFTSFPYIDGYPWNWFLLESYCRRFSKRFRFQCLSVNSRNVGAIFKKSAAFSDYISVMAKAVADSFVELNDKAVGDFLFENRYVAQRTSAVQKVVAQARLLRERRV
jgi:hypothetical protein